MPRSNNPLLTFNHGIVSKLALARIDLTRLKFAAETQDNWLPRTVGPMMLRPGLRYVGGTPSNAVAKLLPFVFAVDDTALLQISSSKLRVLVNDTTVTRPSVSTTVTDPTFVGASWTLTNAGGATSSTAGGLSLSALPLGSKATAKQTLTIGAPDQNVLHALRIVVARGPVRFRVGSATGLDDYIADTSLGTGEHSLAFTPTGAAAYVQFDSSIRYPVAVFSCAVEAAGAMEITVPYVAAEYNLLRITQSGDVVYVACEGHQQRKIERRGTYSWSVVKYLVDDGPFQIAATENVSLTPSGVSGQINLTASQEFFRVSMVDGLLRLVTTSQVSSSAIGADDTFTRAIRVTGVSQGAGTGGSFATGSRQFTIDITGTFVGTVTLQRSFDGEDTGFTDVATYTTAATDEVSDTFDNSIVWYRLGIKTGDYTSGTANVQISYPGGGYAGVVRVDSVTNGTLAVCEVLSQLSAPVATRDWQLGMWSGLFGYPSAVTIYLGRLYWVGRDRIWGSVADAYQSFNADLEGEAGPLSRSIGYGPVQVINWALPIARLILGTGGSEVGVRSSSTDEPLTPTNFGLKDVSTQGSAKIAAVKVDNRGLFVQKSKRRIYQLLFDPNTYDYTVSDLTALLPDLTSDFVCADVQRQSDTRIHFVRADGTVLVILFEPSEEVSCWYSMSSAGASGLIEDVCVLPGTPEDAVYFVVKRTVNGSTVRYIEKMARLDQAIGGTDNRIADSHVVYAGGATYTLTGFSHLEGATVAVWANGKYRGTAVVSGGVVSLTSTANLSAGNTFVTAIKLANKAARDFRIDVSGTWAGTLTLQRSTTSGVAGFVDVATYTANQGVTYTETETFGDVWYRIGFKTAQYTSGTAVAAMSYPPGGATTACAGLAYNADFKSAKLAYAAGQGTALTQVKRISELALICKDTHNAGVTYGPDFDNLDPLPAMYRGVAVAADDVYADFDEPSFEFPGTWSTDQRLCLRATAPLPCTILGAIVTVTTNDKPPPPQPQHAGEG